MKVDDAAPDISSLLDPEMPDVVLAHELVRIRRLSVDAEPACHRDTLTVVTALEVHTDCRFVLQWVAWPDREAPERGRIDVSLLTIIHPAEGGTDLSRRCEEIADDIDDLFGAPPRRWVLSRVQNREKREKLIRPFVPTDVAELARREAPLPPLGYEGTTGFRAELDVREPVRSQLWSLWTLGPPALGTASLAAALLAQEAPVCLRMIVQPTALSGSERSAIDELVIACAADASVQGLPAASLRTLESLLYLRPLFDTRFLVSSPERLSKSLLSQLGHALSAPTPHTAPPQPVLQGGFAVIRQDAETIGGVLRAAFDTLSTGQPRPTLAPDPLGRLRRLYGAWEAANLFRLPAAFDPDDVPGLPIDDQRLPDPPLADLPTTGLRLGAVLDRPGRAAYLPHPDRFRHTYVVGQTGTGKSTLLLNLMLQDVAAGAGVGLLDPHGDLIEALLERIPAERRDDVVLVDPADPVAVVGINLLEADTEVQRQYLISELSNMFYALFDPGHIGIVGPRFESMLRQAALLLLAAKDRPSSFLDIATVFSDDAVRKRLINSIDDPVLSEFWLGEFAQTSDFHRSEVIGWFRSKFEIFRTSTLLRRVVGQASSSISFSDVLRDRRILLVNLSKGMLGEYNSALLGHIALTRLWAAALERATLPDTKRPEFFLYIDEFQNVTTESLPVMLSEARKFRVGLTLANQFFGQLRDSTREALLGNVGTKMAFRLGPKDARLFSDWLGEEMDRETLSNLANFTATAALSPDGRPIAPVAIGTDPAPTPRTDASDVRAASRDHWAKPVNEVDEEFRTRWADVPGSISSKTRGKDSAVVRTVQFGNSPAVSSPSAAPQPAAQPTPVDQPRPRRLHFIDQWIVDQLAGRPAAEPVTLRVEPMPDPPPLRLVHRLALVTRLQPDVIADLVWPLGAQGRFVLPLPAARAAELMFLRWGYTANVADQQPVDGASLPPLSLDAEIDRLGVLGLAPGDLNGLRRIVTEQMQGNDGRSDVRTVLDQVAQRLPDIYRYLIRPGVMQARKTEKPGKP